MNNSQIHEYKFSYNFSPVPPIMKRGRHVLIVVRSNDGKFLLGAKDIYPQNIYRFIGGGIEKNENILFAAKREVEEELKISVDHENLKPLAKFEVNITDGAENIIFETYLFYMRLSDQDVTASDDLNGIVYMTKKELEDLADRYEHLSDELIDLGGDTKKGGPFRWSDYGKFYGQVHRIALQLVDQM